MSTNDHLAANLLLADGLSRRRLAQHLLGVLSLASSLQAMGSTASGSSPRPTDNWFSLGVASGSPTESSVVLWTRLAPPDREALLRASPTGQVGIVVHWQLARDQGFTQVVASGSTLAAAGLDYSVHVEPQGLAPDRWYFYRFSVGDLISPTGRTRTMPAADAQLKQFRIAYASCQNADQGHWAAWRHMQREDLDAVMFLGDYIYEYPMIGRYGHPRSLNWAYDLASYRERYTLYKSHPQLQAMHAQVPWFLTWDDHEVQNDYAGVQAGFSGPPNVDFVTRRAHAMQAYYENLPVSLSSLTQGLKGLLKGEELRLYKRIPVGRLLTLSMLDVRQYKGPTPCDLLERRAKNRVSPDQCAKWGDSARTMLGMQQEAWLDQSFTLAGATQPPATWNVLAQGTLFGKRDNLAGEGESYFYEGWDAYDGARRRLVNGLMRHRVPNPVMLGGDVHEHWVGYVMSDYRRPESQKVGVEFTTTSISSRGGSKSDSAALLAENPHFIHHTPDKRGYGVLQFTPKMLVADIRGLDDVTREDSGIASLAKFAVPAGRALLEPV